MEAKIAQERGKRAERTAGYSNDDNALRREFGIDLEPEASQPARGSFADPGEDLGGLDEAAVPRELADAREQVEESDREDIGMDCAITTL